MKRVDNSITAVYYIDLVMDTDGLSEVADIEGSVPVALQVSTDWSTDALTLSFLGSIKSTESSDFFNLFTDTGEEIVAVIPDGLTYQYQIPLNPTALFLGLRYMRIRAGTAASPVPMSSDGKVVRIIYRTRL